MNNKSLVITIPRLGQMYGLYVILLYIKKIKKKLTIMVPDETLSTLILFQDYTLINYIHPWTNV